MTYKFDSKEHLHLLDDRALTGTSSIGNILAKNLTWWAAELSAVECLEAGEKIPTIREEYLAAVNSKDKKKAIDELQIKYPLFKKARFAHFDKKNKAAEEGTDLHNILEQFVRAEMRRYKNELTKEGKIKLGYPNNEELNKIKPFIDWADANVKQFIASEAHCFDEELWVGGITDCVAELMNGRYAVIDFKSAKEAYPTHFLQVAGYAIQIEKNGLWDINGTVNKKLDDNIKALIVVPFGAEKVEPSIRYDLDSYKQGFRYAVGLYRLLGLEK